MIHVKIKSIKHKVSIFKITLSWKDIRIFLNEDHIRLDQAKLRKKIEKVKETMGKKNKK